MADMNVVIPQSPFNFEKCGNVHQRLQEVVTRRCA